MCFFGPWHDFSEIRYMKAHTILADQYHKGITQLSFPGFSLRLKSKMGEVCNFSEETQVKNLHHF